MSKISEINSFEDLETWQRCHSLVLEIYHLTETFPDKEKFGLVTQMERAAVSVTSNIAEGFGRYNFLDKVRFYYFSSGSISELKNQLIIAKDLGYMNQNNFKNVYELMQECHRLLRGLINSTKNQIKN